MDGVDWAAEAVKLEAALIDLVASIAAAKAQGLALQATLATMVANNGKEERE